MILPYHWSLIICRCLFFFFHLPGVEIQCIGHFKLLFSLLSLNGCPKLQMLAVEVCNLKLVICCYQAVYSSVRPSTESVFVGLVHPFIVSLPPPPTFTFTAIHFHFYPFPFFRPYRWWLQTRSAWMTSRHLTSWSTYYWPCTHYQQVFIWLFFCRLEK